MKIPFRSVKRPAQRRYERPKSDIARPAEVRKHGTERRCRAGTTAGKMQSQNQRKPPDGMRLPDRARMQDRNDCRKKCNRRTRGTPRMECDYRTGHGHGAETAAGQRGPSGREASTEQKSPQDRTQLFGVNEPPNGAALRNSEHAGAAEQPAIQRTRCRPCRKAGRATPPSSRSGRLRR